MDSNEKLHKTLQEAQVDILSSSDEAFEKAKAQALFLYPVLNVFEMGFFKTVVDGRLVNMEEDQSSPNVETSKDDTNGEGSPDINV